MKPPETNRPTPFPGHVFWLFGLSGAGKTTLATLLASDLRARGVAVLLLDGDVLRSGLCKGLGFSDTDRAENLRRSAEVARIALQSNLCVIAAFITPLEPHRRLVTEVIGADRISTVWVNAPLATCRERDVKGLYAGAHAGAVPQMSGLDSRFEPPARSSLMIDTKNQTASASGVLLWRFACQRLGLPV